MTQPRLILSCERALSYGALSYREVKSILEKKLYLVEPQECLPPVLGGYGHDLSTYDNILLIYTMEAIKERLKQLKLSGASKSLETRIDYAQSKKSVILTS